MSLPISNTNQENSNSNIFSLRELRRNGQAPLRHEVSGSTFSGIINCSRISSFFQTIVEPNSLVCKFSNIAKKTWIQINTNWDIIAFGISLIALGCFVNQDIANNLIIITKQLSIGFFAGFTISHFCSTPNETIFDKLRNLSPLTSFVLTIATPLLSPIVPLASGFIIGNHTYHRYS
jgi:hypothetical protein